MNSSTGLLRRPAPVRPARPADTVRPAAEDRWLAAHWQRLALAALLLVTAAAYVWNLSASGDANSFYAAAVQAGTKSWKAMFFGSSDSSNFITVDKPPAFLWPMEISARIFGLNSWSILVPQALMGIAATALMYDLMRRRFGRPAGFTAGFVLATTPIIVAMSRHNNPDELLVLCTVAAIWFILVNTQRVSIYLWVPKITSPLWLVLVITFAAGLITGLLLRRRNRGGQATR